MFKKRNSFWALAIAILVTSVILVFPPQVVFDYDFESFFPQDDEELSYFLDFREQFGNDNDYLLVALGGQEIFESSFLKEAEKINSKLKELELVESTVSLLDLKEPVIGAFGVRSREVLDIDGDLEKQREKILNSAQWSDNLIDQDGKYLLIVVNNKQQISKEGGDELYAEISAILEDSTIKEIKTAGKIKAQGEFVELLQEEFAFFLSISFVLIVILLYAIFRSFWGVLTPLLILGVGIFWTLSLSLYLGNPLDVMSVMKPTILSVIGLAALVHFFNHYLNMLREGKGKEEAINASFSELILAVFLTALTTSLGFLSLYLTTVPSLKFFGLHTGIGVMIMFLAVISIAPGLLYLFAPLKIANSERLTERWRIGMRNAFLKVTSLRTPIVIAFVLISIASAIGLSELKVNGYILDNLPRHHALVKEFEFFDDFFGGSKPLELSLSVGEKGEDLLDREVLLEIEKLEAFVLDNYQSAVVLSPLSLVKGINKAQNAGNENAYRLPSPAQMSKVKEFIPKAIEESPVTLLSKSYQEGRLSTRTSDMGSLKSKELRKELENFLEEKINQDLLKVRLTGTSNLIDISHESVTKQTARGLGLAFLIVAVVAGFLFRSWRISMVVLVPNIIPLLWMCGVMWLLGIELKLTTAIIFTVAFGIAVDDSIHFMSKMRIELSKGKSWLYALKRTYLETGKAIILTTLILGSGFSILTLSQFGVTFYSGLLISLALVFALLADLLLLPLMLIPLKKIWDKKQD
ncbi:MAG: RND transporter [Mongoliibacter sp.]|uniref:efflux RND transporter permease subunit n=1 Tax=Mongoliibacter sp. TaxID=2022438 RepID=UPI0012F0EFE5|nr:efflux RND transporter permease subunit [Mongoliibacter sp.]TVP47617.1 MAG: RND transporter [Mongoliibacter sp.]